jgi:hypothetical protein
VALVRGLGLRASLSYSRNSQFGTNLDFQAANLSLPIPSAQNIPTLLVFYGVSRCLVGTLKRDLQHEQPLIQDGRVSEVNLGTYYRFGV